MAGDGREAVLALNAGSSSLKFGLYDIAGYIACLTRGSVTRGADGNRVRAKGADGESIEHHLSTTPLDEAGLIEQLLAWIAKTFDRAEPKAVGHRIVHGGTLFTAPTLLSAEAIDAVASLTPLAPLHQPPAVALIRAVQEVAPHLTQVGCFDTAFHHRLSPPVSRYAIPRAYEREGVRRYGFHGLSYDYVASELANRSAERTVVAHLGNGASLCALVNGESCDTTMGFSALDGLAMSTRPGQIDAGILLYLLQRKGMTPGELETLLYRESGLKGVSGISGDVRELLASSAPEAAEAIDLFVFRIARETAAMANTLEGLDVFVFTGGIGEHSAPIRKRVAERLAWLGVSLDEAANSGNERRISTQSSCVEVFVFPTDEEMVIARQTVALLNGRR
ncbi:acetate/propionate family kinase [Devosia nitrariae]|uniref:Acetate kinase n=1 Tax=Devosia nitrariae TaxID=2071872 RepID=A0ABQ5W9J1_9HYPH|nr:acetate/propionate family kinase [Devosia nitrariae]GLQ56637.1 acetate kinase [Devosia nitrariae]